MEASGHPVSGTYQYGSPHHLEGQWAGRYSRAEKDGADPPQVILVHRVDGKPSVLFGTKLRGDNIIGDDCITFWFESDNKSTGDTLVGKGRYAAPNTARGSLIFFFSSFLLFSFFFSVSWRCAQGVFAAANIFSCPSSYVGRRRAKMAFERCIYSGV